MGCEGHEVADRVFRMALKIEGASANFYQMAAEGATNAEAKRLFSSLETAEKGHVKIVSTLMEECETHPKRYGELELSAELEAELKGMSEGFIAENLETLPSFYEESSIQNVLELAIEFEKNTVNFYVQVKKLIRGSSATRAVENLMAEENDHISTLRDALEQIA